MNAQTKTRVRKQIGFIRKLADQAERQLDATGLADECRKSLKLISDNANDARSLLGIADADGPYEDARVNPKRR